MANTKRVSVKFGGTSMGSAKSMEQCADIIATKLKAKEQVVVTVSAVSGITDLLEQAIEIAIANQPRKLDNIYQEIVAKHIRVLDEITGQNGSNKNTQDIRKDLEEILGRIQVILQGTSLVGDMSDRSRALITSMGERLSSYLFTLILRHKGIAAERIQAEKIIKTDDQYLEAEVNYPATSVACRKVLEPLLKKNIVPVVTGFIGKDPHGGTTLLGRGGSDYTCAILGTSLHVDHIELRKDVTGVLSSDPRVIKNIRQWQEIDMEIMSELCYSGGKIVYPKTISTALKHKIPIHIKSTFEPDAPGTIIAFKQTKNVRTLVLDHGFTLIHLDNPNIMDQVGFIARVTNIVESHGVPIDVCATSETSFSFSIRSKDLSNKLKRDLKNFGKVMTFPRLTKISIVGHGLSTNFDFIKRVYSHVDAHKISMHTSSIGASGRNITLLCENKNIPAFAQSLHDDLLKTVQNVN